MTTQSRADGSFFDGQDPRHPTDAEVLLILQTAFDQGPAWNATVTPQVQQGRYRWYQVALATYNEAIDIRVYVFKNFAFAHRDNPREKRIQITEDSHHHNADFQRPKVGPARCLLLGIYLQDVNDPIIIAWDTNRYVNHGRSRSCYASIDLVSSAYKYGLSKEYNAAGHAVCAFKPRFMNFFLKNMNLLFEERRNGQDDEIDVEDPNHEDIRGGSNILFYGAPGTGKSTAADFMSREGIVFRTSFYETTEFTDFFGTIRPGSDDGRVTYHFSPGPFSTALAAALSSPTQHVFLIIEEINRGRAAAIFGDLFVLLDRRAGGRSVYEMEPPSREMRRWLSRETGQNVDKIFIPPNLSILATMNSADQGVFFLDTAFRRRWQQKYVPIDFAQCPEIRLEITLRDGNTLDVLWSDFAQSVNEILSNGLEMPEDRLIGPWFIFDDDVAESNQVPSKVLIYLWDDILRHGGREQIFDLEVVSRYGDVSRRIAAADHVFAADLLDRIVARTQRAGDAAPEGVADVQEDLGGAPDDVVNALGGEVAIAIQQHLPVPDQD